MHSVIALCLTTPLGLLAFSRSVRHTVTLQTKLDTAYSKHLTSEGDKSNSSPDGQQRPQAKRSQGEKWTESAQVTTIEKTNRMAHVAHGLGVYASRLPRPRSELKAQQSFFLTSAQLFHFCFLSAK